MNNYFNRLVYFFFLTFFLVTPLLGNCDTEEFPMEEKLMAQENITINTVTLVPKVKYTYNDGCEYEHLFNDSVKVLWLFNDGTYSLNRNESYLPTSTPENDGLVELKTNARYKPSDPIRFEFNSNGIGVQDPVLMDSGESIHIAKSWEPVSGDANNDYYIYYIITIENSTCDGDSTNAIVSIRYPKDNNAIIIDDGFLHGDGFNPLTQFSTNGLRVYSFIDLPYGSINQKHLIVRARVKNDLIINDTFDVGVNLFAGEFDIAGYDPKTDKTGTPCLSLSNDVITNQVTKAPTDPNNKVVSRETIYIGQGEQELLYTINFQNIEGGIASKVVLIDYFDLEYLDTSRLEIIAQSHPYDSIWKNGKLHIIFENINILSVEDFKTQKWQQKLSKIVPNQTFSEKEKKIWEKTLDYSPTKGFITYRVFLKEPYNIGNIISNKALIKFYQYNEADNDYEMDDIVPTEEVLTTVKSLNCTVECTSDCKVLNCLCFIIAILSISILLLLLIIFVRKLR